MFKSKLAILLVALVISEISSADLTSGLVAYWSFDDCKATDSSGNGHNGIINGTPKCVTGINGKALQFNGVNDFIEVADTPELRLSGTNYTLSGWVNLKDYNQSYQSSLISKRVQNMSEDGYLWSLTGYAAKTEYNNPLGSPNWNLSGGSDPWIVSTKGIPLNNWRHIVVTYDSNTQTIKLYVNNVLETSSINFPSPNPDATVSLIITQVVSRKFNNSML